jgi:hypothetical protein
MVGASYGGGIQVVTAAIDPRVDAIVPTIAWHSLNTSLYEDQAFMSGWGTILAAALTFTGARANPRTLPAATIGDHRRPARGYRSAVRVGGPTRETVLVEHVSGSDGHSDRCVAGASLRLEGRSMR